MRRGSKAAFSGNWKALQFTGWIFIPHSPEDRGLRFHPSAHLSQVDPKDKKKQKNTPTHISWIFSFSCSSEQNKWYNSDQTADGII